MTNVTMADWGKRPAERADEPRPRGEYVAPEVVPVGTLALVQGDGGTKYDDEVFCRYGS